MRTGQFDPQRTLSPRSENRSSCPEADLRRWIKNRLYRVKPAVRPAHDGGSCPKAWCRRVLGGGRELIIINDEAHHVYGEKRVRKGEESAYIK
jgi:hypothetical protein